MNKMGGFTLIELMVAVAIVGILASVAIPSYQDNVRKSRRADAMAGIAAAAANQERYFSMNNAYIANADPFAGDAVIDSPEGYYRISVAVRLSPSGSAVGYTVTATAPAGSAQASDSCGGFSISNTGKKAVTTGTVADCWS
jgi:type IV pilus assembly protein PilE